MVDFLMDSGAVIDPSGVYRYLLWRIWDPHKPCTVFIMLNPSTADWVQDDPTIKRCINFAKIWGSGGIKVVNLFALRATNPRELYSAAEPVGTENDKYIMDTIEGAERIIAAWGTKGCFKGRDVEVIRMLKDRLYCLEVTKDSHPKHPLYISGDRVPIKYLPERAC